METFNPVMEMLSGINMRVIGEKQGAVRNKLKSFHSDMSGFWHKYMDSCGEMMVSSGRNVWVTVAVCVSGAEDRE